MSEVGVDTDLGESSIRASHVGGQDEEREGGGGGGASGADDAVLLSPTESAPESSDLVHQTLYDCCICNQTTATTQHRPVALISFLQSTSSMLYNLLSVSYLVSTVHQRYVI